MALFFIFATQTHSLMETNKKLKELKTMSEAIVFMIAFTASALAIGVIALAFMFVQKCNEITRLTQVREQTLHKTSSKEEES